MISVGFKRRLRALAVRYAEVCALVLRYDACERGWVPETKTSGHLRRGWWRCPAGGNALRTEDRTDGE